MSSWSPVSILVQVSLSLLFVSHLAYLVDGLSILHERLCLFLLDEFELKENFG